MHPILADRRRFALYLVAWLPLGALLGAALAWVGSIPLGEAYTVAVFLALLLAFLCLAAWYPCRALVIGRAGVANLLFTHLLAAFLSSALWIFLGRAGVGLLARSPQFSGATDRFAPLWLGLFIVGALFYLLSTALHYLWFALVESREAERRQLELRVLAREAELRALRAQIDPHFLFNSLNSISALTATDARAARAMTLELADFLRKTLDLGSKERISLDEELDLAKTYLGVERVRFGDRLRMEFDVEEEALSCPIPPLLLQPLVENAVQHGISQLVDGGTIAIAARRSGNRLEVSIENPRDPAVRRSRGGGLGLVNVGSRLEALFDGEARISTVADGPAFRVDLAVPLEDWP